MTAGLHEVYQFDGKLFWTNRLLRLLPPYFLVCLITLLVVIQVPAEAGAYLPYWVSDAPRYDIALNLLIIPQQYPELGFRLVPPFSLRHATKAQPSQRFGSEASIISHACTAVSALARATSRHPLRPWHSLPEH
jgi:hypothetical protein